MAAPEYVPLSPNEKARVYESPPWRGESWTAGRPADLDEGQPIGPHLGYPGPDQGFVLKLARTFEGTLSLAPGEHEADALAGASAGALRRASLFGRAPVIHDLTIALSVYGYLGDAASDPARIEHRRRLFDGCSGLHHYGDLRAIADAVDEDVLRKTPEQVAQLVKTNWRDAFV